jgi:hypothetical protein
MPPSPRDNGEAGPSGTVKEPTDERIDHFYKHFARIERRGRH